MLPNEAVSERPAPTRRLATALWPYALLVAVGLLILMPKLGDYGFWDPWEPKYGETVREMIERDSYVVPYYRDKVRLAKPILVYWGILAGSAVFGLNEFGARIVGVLFAISSLLAVFYAIALMRGRQAGLISALVLATAPQFFFISRQATPDVYLFVSIGLSLVYFCLGLYGPAGRRDLHFGVSYFCFALAVLAKGPVVAGAIAFGTLAIFGFAHVDWWRLWKDGQHTRLVKFVLASVPLTLLLAAIGSTGLLFATRTIGGGEEPSGADRIRDRLGQAIGGARLDDLALALLAAAAGIGLLLLFRRGGSRAGFRLGAAAGLATAAAIAVGSIFLAPPDSKIVMASLLAALAVVAALAALAWRFLRHPDLWPQVGPLLRPVVRQAVLFLIIFTVVAGPWHLAIIFEQGNRFLTYFIFEHNIERAADKINQSGAADFYLRVLTFGLFPWSCFLPIALGSLAGLADRKLLKKYGVEIFLLIALGVTIAAFSVSTTKFAHYLAPALIPASILAGLTIHRTLEARDTAASRLAWIVAFLLFLLPAMDLVRQQGSQYLVGSYTVKRFVPDGMGLGDIWYALLVAVGVIMLLSIAARSRILVGAMIACVVLMASHTNAVFIPALSVHKTMRDLTSTWKEQATNGEPIGFYGDLKHGIYFYTDYTVKRLRNAPDFNDFMDPENPAFCIVQKTKISRLDEDFREKYPGFQLRVIDDSHFKYNLVRIVSARDGRRPAG